MFEQLTQLVQQFGNDAVVNNSAIPNEHNEDVMNEASNSILSGLKNIASEGGTEDLAALIQGKTPIDASNETASSNVAENLIPKVLGSLVGNAQDPNHKGFEVTDLVNAISGGNGNSGLMDAVSKYGGQFGLDQNADGKVDVNDAIAAVSSKGGFGSLLGKLFGK